MVSARSATLVGRGEGEVTRSFASAPRAASGSSLAPAGSGRGAPCPCSVEPDCFLSLGTRMAKRAQVGDVVGVEQPSGSGNALFDLGDLRRLDVIVEVPEGTVNQVFQGQSAASRRTPSLRCVIRAIPPCISLRSGVTAVP
jgi:hypothetical protein